MRASGDRATGLIITSATTPIVLLALLYATQLTLRLHALGTLRTAAETAASTVADRPQGVGGAEAELRSALGDAGGEARVDWTVGPDAVVLRVSVEPPAAGRLSPFGARDRIEHIARARLEQWR